MALPELKPIARTSVSDAIANQLVELISQGSLKPGDRIPSEKQLCEQFNVGRTSVREALRSLAGMGFLESHAGEGTFVTQDSSKYLERAFHWGLLLDRKIIDDLIDTRLMLETHTAKLAARKASAADLAEMDSALRGMAASMESPAEYLEHDLRFHLAIAKATQNSILQSLLSTTRAYLQAWIQQTLTATPNAVRRRAKLSVAEHKQILKALREHDAKAAGKAMSAHIFSSSADLVRE
jgi:GntR family transcriptional repressor for pyruvate dehydrogenase complex